MSESFGVLLVRKVGHVLDYTFAYRSERLPELGDEIEISQSTGHSILAKVTGIEETKTLPIRAAEIQRDVEPSEPQDPYGSWDAAAAS